MTLIRRRNTNQPNYTSLFNHFLNDAAWGEGVRKNWSGGASYPAVNIKENDGNYEIELVAPGLKRDDLEVKVEENTLHIGYEFKANKDENEKEGKYVRKEFAFGSFKRAFSLPEDSVNQEAIDAKFEAGILLVTVPKKEVAPKNPARLIEIG